MNTAVPAWTEATSHRRTHLVAPKTTRSIASIGNLKWLRSARTYRLLIGTLIALLCHVASAAQLITFEEIAAGGPGQGTGTPVLNFYAAQGVIFKAAALDYSKGIGIANFAHSGTKGIETCIAVEFCTAPIEASFTTPQARVKIRVGFDSALTQPITVVMRAFASNGTQVGQASATLNSNAVPTSIQTPIEITTATATITRVAVAIENGSTLAFTNGLAIDDFEFDVAGPPPNCSAVSDPEVTLSQPATGLQTQFNQFVLAFKVATADPFATTTVTATVGAQTRSTTFAGLSGPFGPIAVNGLLFPGSNTVIVAVKDCFGNAQVGTIVVFSPIAADERLHVMAFEATQVVQNVPSSIPLVANKSTLVRVYVNATGSTPAINNLRATLFAFRPLNNEQTRGPVLTEVVHSTNTITATTSTDLKARRLALNQSLNFQLPVDWLVAGAISFGVRFEIDGSPSSPVAIPCDGCENNFGNGKPVFSHFIDMPVMRLRIVGMQYLFGTPQDLQTPRALDFTLLTSWVQRAYPAGIFDITTSMVTASNAWQFDCDAANAQLSAIRATEVAAGRDSHTHYVALVINSGGFMRGCANDVPGSPDTSVVASLPTGDTAAGQGPRPINVTGDTDGSFGDWYGGHELAHEFGRAHPGFCNSNSSDDDQFPNPNGQISDNLQTFVGLDMGDVPNGIAQAVISPFALDIMTYCNQPQWFSAYNYLAVMQRLRAENNLPNLFRAAHSSPAETASTAASVRLPNETMVGDFVNVVAAVNLTKHTGTIRYINHVRKATVPATQANQIAAIQLRDKTGKVIRSVATSVRLDSDLAPGDDKIGLVQVVMPVDAAAARVELLVAGKILNARAISVHAPTVSQLKLTPEKLPCGTGTQTVLTWLGADADKDALTYLVQMSNGRDAWDTLSLGLKSSRLVLPAQPAEALQSRRSRTLRVIANDGYNDSLPGEISMTAP